MKSYVIPSEKWSEFFNDFSRRHRCRRTTLETITSDHGVRSNARGLPMVGITVEAAAAGGNGKPAAIEIALSDGRAAHVTRTIRNPSRVIVSEWNNGRSAAVQVEYDRGLSTVIYVGPRAQERPMEFILEQFQTQALVAEDGRVLAHAATD